MNTHRTWGYIIGVILLLMLITVNSCKKESGKVPSVTTSQVSGITATGAHAGGTITSDGGSTVTERGVCWNTIGEPTIADSKANDGSSGTGSFTATLSGLTGNVTYYVRAYALNGAGVGYGEVKAFTTLAVSADAVTLLATDVKSVQANLHGWVNAGNQSTSVSFEYGATTAYGQTITATPATVYTNSDSVMASLTGLTPLTTYHYRIKINNIYGTAFGNDMTFYTGYTKGERALGGIVFNIDASGTHGMVVSDSSIAASIAWYNGSYVVTNATATAIGTGQANTTDIVAAQGAGTYAASLCANLVRGGYSDWYLPSADEMLDAISSNVNIPIGLYGSYFWTSSEVDANNAYLIHVTNLQYSSKQTYDKNSLTGPGLQVGSTIPIEIRAVRSF